MRTPQDTGRYWSRDNAEDALNTIRNYNIAPGARITDKPDGFPILSGTTPDGFKFEVEYEYENNGWFNYAVETRITRRDGHCAKFPEYSLRAAFEEAGVDLSRFPARRKGGC